MLFRSFSVPAGTPGTGRYCPKLAGTAGTRPVRPVFFPVRNRRVECTGLLAGTVYSGRYDRYGTVLTSMIKIVSAYVKRIKKVVKDTFFFWFYVNACVNFTSITKCKESE